MMNVAFDKASKGRKLYAFAASLHHDVPVDAAFRAVHDEPIDEAAWEALASKLASDAGRRSVERIKTRTSVAPEPKVPAGYERDLSGYGPVATDACCGEPVAWGFKIRSRLGEERFNALNKFGTTECTDHSQRTWALVTKRITRAEAIEKYGAVTNEERGPRGGFRSVTFGSKRFLCRDLDV